MLKYLKIFLLIAPIYPHDPFNEWTSFLTSNHCWVYKTKTCHARVGQCSCNVKWVKHIWFEQEHV